MEFNGSTIKDRSDVPSHHERVLLPRSYILPPPPSIQRPTFSCSAFALFFATVVYHSCSCGIFYILLVLAEVQMNAFTVRFINLIKVIS